MSAEQKVSGPDLKEGVPLSDVPDGGTLVGHVDGEAVLLARRGNDVFAVGATCTHYGGPLGDGTFEGDTIRCPWHHACFNIRTGTAESAPALNALPCWRVERREERLIVLEKRPPASIAPGQNAASGKVKSTGHPSSIVIVGGGAAAGAAAEMLRREGYAGRLQMISADSSAPYDRPNLSKDYLAGAAPEEWIPLRPDDFYRDHGIELELNAAVRELDLKKRELELPGGRRVTFDALLLATGAEPILLDLPGVGRPHVHTLRSLADCRKIIQGARDAKFAVVIGASFIGLEVAASLRSRGLEVSVVAPESPPFERVMGAQLGARIQRIHEEHGVRFHLNDRPRSIGEREVETERGERLRSDLVVIGIGVRPRTELAEKSGIKVDRGILVSDRLETNVPNVYAAGDAARWYDKRSGGPVRIEHWVVAQRQGQVAALNLLGASMPFLHVPFFWSQHYDVSVAYVGHAAEWDRIDVDGDIEKLDCALAYRRDGSTLAVVTIARDAVSLAAESALAQGDEATLRRLIPG